MHLTVFLIPIAVIVFLMRLPKVASRAMVLRLLAIGLERNVALGPLVLGFAEESGWWEQRKLCQLGRRLEGGFSVPEALDSLGGFVPPEISAAAFTAEACGNLPETLRRLSLEWEQNSIERGRQLPIAVLYFSILSSLLAGILGFLSIYVLPKYKAIFQDFGLKLPKEVGGIPLSLDALYVILAWSDVAMLLVLAVLVFKGRRYFSRFFGGEGAESVFSAWTFSLHPRRQAPLILKNLQVPLQTGKPLSFGIEILTIHHPFSFMRQKMLHVLDDLMDGVSCWESLRRFRLINDAEFGLLETAERGHNLEWMLGELARSQERRANRRWDALGIILQPCLVGLLGIIVCWIALAFFYPLILILQNLV